jgi:hypothetical protein
LSTHLKTRLVDLRKAKEEKGIGVAEKGLTYPPCHSRWIFTIAVTTVRKHSGQGGKPLLRY